MDSRAVLEQKRRAVILGVCVVFNNQNVTDVTLLPLTVTGDALVGLYTRVPELVVPLTHRARAIRQCRWAVLDEPRSRFRLESVSKETRPWNFFTLWGRQKANLRESDARLGVYRQLPKAFVGTTFGAGFLDFFGELGEEILAVVAEGRKVCSHSILFVIFSVYDV